MNYYNEFDPKAAAWLQQLIDDKQIPQGHVDSRSILEVQPSDLSGFTQCHFFAGVGGWSLALQLAGWPVTRPVWTASLPCQPFSTAGKQRGTSDERHLAPTFLELVRQCDPPSLFGEQVASKLARTDWLPGIRLELEALGYAFGATDLCAPCAGEIGEGWIVRGDQESWERIIIGHPHIRQRLYWVASRMAHTNSDIGCGLCGLPTQPEEGTKHSNFSGMAHTDSLVELRDSRSGDEGTGPCGEPLGRGLLEAGSDGTHSDLGIPDTGSQGFQGHGEPRNQPLPPGWQGAHGHGSENSTALFLPCRDGKTRRTECGIFPLVNGIPRGVVPSGDPDDPSYANATAEARAVRLKGYGNAIVPPLAALFIRSTMEVIDA